MRDVTEQVVYRTREMQRAEAHFGEPMDVLLNRWYLEEGLGIADIGDRLGITKSAVSRWLERFGIETRQRGRVA